MFVRQVLTTAFCRISQSELTDLLQRLNRRRENRFDRSSDDRVREHMRAASDCYRPVKLDC